MWIHVWEWKFTNGSSQFPFVSWDSRHNILFYFIDTNEQSGLNGFANLSSLQGFESLTCFGLVKE
jgi:hypothetical protein